ncbi:hypothetical protein F2Q68_00024179 [Brassica cretica]|uniref:STAR protein homodimerisation region domain-containing protein n=1 Tax=Brassica cretica TaxID=69181 RepID=A0A8S9IKN9_BRACR|nr:hypothetical protein F2Q68_00024179 [Brassica cretica]
MSGLYNNNSSYFSPARAASPQIRSTPEIDSSQYLTELLAEHQKLTPFMQVLPICSRLLNQEMFRVSGMMPPNQGFGDFDRLRHRSPSPMASSNLMSNVSNTGLGGWNGGLSQEREEEEEEERLMSGLYNNNSSYFSPARAASPQIRSTPEIDSSQYLTELLAEHQKLTPFMQVLPICSRLLNQEMFRVSGMMPPNQGFGDFDRLRHRSPSPMASSNLMSNVSNTGLGGWNGGLSQEKQKKEELQTPKLLNSPTYESLRH